MTQAQCLTNWETSVAPVGEWGQRYVARSCGGRLVLLSLSSPCSPQKCPLSSLPGWYLLDLFELVEQSCGLNCLGMMAITSYITHKSLFHRT